MSEKDVPKVTVGVVLYQDEAYSLSDYLASFFESVFSQTYPSFEVIVLENGSFDTSYIEPLQKKYPEIRIVSSKQNKGFGGGHNMLLHTSTAPYYLVLNPDMILEKKFFEHLVAVLEQDEKIACVTGKIYQWDFTSYRRSEGKDMGKTTVIDTLGIGITKSHRFYDINQGKTESANVAHQKPYEIFGASGVCMLLRRSALEQIRYENEYFDEMMFMYKEDIDLSYRLRWAGFEIYLAPQSVAYHDRSVSKMSFRAKSDMVQNQSYLNEKILLYKNLDPGMSFLIRWMTFFRQVLKRIYITFFARSVLAQEAKFHEILPILDQKRNMLVRKINSCNIESFMT